MKRVASVTSAASFVAAIVASSLPAQQPQGPQPFTVGNRLGLPVTPGRGRRRSSRSRRTSRSSAPSTPRRVARTTRSAASSWCRTAACRRTFRPTTPGSRSSTTTGRFTRRAGSACRTHAERANLTPPLVLNEPYGSDIANGMLYVADRDGGTTAERAERRGHSPVQHADRARLPARFASNGPPGSTTSRSRTTARSTPRRRAIAARMPDPVDVAGLEDHAGRHGVDLRAGRAAPSAQRHRLRPAGQHRRRQHRQRRSADVLTRPASS